MSFGGEEIEKRLKTIEEQYYNIGYEFYNNCFDAEKENVLNKTCNSSFKEKVDILEKKMDELKDGIQFSFRKNYIQEKEFSDFEDRLDHLFNNIVFLKIDLQKINFTDQIYKNKNVNEVVDIKSSNNDVIREDDKENNEEENKQDIVVNEDENKNIYKNEENKVDKENDIKNNIKIFQNLLQNQESENNNIDNDDSIKIIQRMLENNDQKKNIVKKTNSNVDIINSKYNDIKYEYDYIKKEFDEYIKNNIKIDIYNNPKLKEQYYSALNYTDILKNDLSKLSLKVDEYSKYLTKKEID